MFNGAMSTHVRAVVPAKALHEAKSRLGREDLTLAFLADVLGALSNSASVTSIAVVTSDPLIAELAQDLGCQVVSEGQEVGLTAAIKTGIDYCIQLDSQNGPENHRILVVLGDLPCLTSDHIDSFIELAAPFDCAFLSDSEGIGSTMWIRRSQSEAVPRFGIRSRASHREVGAQEISDPSLRGARRDVDTEIDLWDAIRIGVGESTQGALQKKAEPQLVTVSALQPLSVVTESGQEINVAIDVNSELTQPRIGQRLVLLTDNFVIEQKWGLTQESGRHPKAAATHSNL